MKQLIFIYCVVLVSLNAYSQLEPKEDSILVRFQVTDFNLIPEEGAVVRGSGDMNFNFTVDIDGKKEILLPKGSTIELEIDKYDTTFAMGAIQLPEQKGLLILNQTLKIRIVTEEYKRTFKLDILFPTNGHTLTDKDKTMLNTLVSDMKKNPMMRVELAAHTDNIGNDVDNMRLSQKRANAVKEYLVSKNISENRILAKGYGKAQPIADNDTNEGRAKNRRTEVRVISE